VHYPTGRYCARCTYPLCYITQKYAYIDHCYRCGGSFLDFGKATQAIGEKADPRNWPKEVLARPPYPSQLLCPSGHGRMWAYLVGYEGKFCEIDACPVCHGLWLDAREAEALDSITTTAHVENARPGSSLGTVGVVGMYLVQLATMIPIEVHHPVKRKPILVHSTIIACALVWILELTMFVQDKGQQIMDALAFTPARFTSGQAPWTVLTCAFMHGGWSHIIGNMVFLWIFGDNVEDRLGRTRFTILYAATAILATLAHYASNIHSDTPLVGASGAIAGLMGAYFVLFPRVKLWVVILFVPFKIRAFWYLLIWIGMQFLIMLDKKSNVAWLAHVGGFVAGVALAFILKPKGEPASAAVAA
jgi:membrane associated rhomboid family serine protease/Zn-finger nucleic acid-binding protein